MDSLNWTDMLSRSLPRPITLLALLVFVTGCGGGGGSPDPPLPQYKWTRGEYPDLEDHINKCQSPRVGIDSATNNSYTDTQGSYLDEKIFLRSLSDYIYLWYDEIYDRNPNDMSTPVDYFYYLKTFSRTLSGKDKDSYHFTYNTEDWRKQSEEGITVSYGATFSLIRRTPPRKIVVAYTQPNSPASEVNLLRGVEILTIDGADVVNAFDDESIGKINQGLYPRSSGERHRFTVKDPGSTVARPIELQSKEIVENAVLEQQTLQDGESKIGYILFNDHSHESEGELIEAFGQLAESNVKELVLDLRYNSGGLLGVAKEVAYMVGGEHVESKTFETLTFNDKHQTINPVNGELLTPIVIENHAEGFSKSVEAKQLLPTLNLSKLYVLTSSATCSASEAIINGLRGADVEVIQIGGRTCGKPYGFYPISNCGTTYFTIQFKGINNKGFGDYPDGFVPVADPLFNRPDTVRGCEVEDDYNHYLGDARERLLSTAIYYIENGACPEASSEEASAIGSLAASKGASDVIIRKPLWLQNRVVLLPR